MRCRRAVIALVLACAAGAGLPPTVATAAPAAAPAIVGGHYPRTDTPWAAPVSLDGRYWCMATIVSRYWLLTAAHCVAEAKASALTARIGTRYHTRGHARSIREIVVHPLYVRSDGERYDVALLRLDRPVHTTYVALGAARAGDRMTVYGFGATQHGPRSFEIKRANVLATGVDLDWLTYRRIDGMPGGGDSGGPVFAHRRQVGVISAGGSDSGYGTRVDTVRGWIRLVSGA